MTSLINLDLLWIGLAVAGAGTLGFSIYFTEPKSATSRSFLFFSLVSILWGIVNFASGRFTTFASVLWSIRFVLFFATWHAFSFFILAKQFPEKKSLFRARVFYPLVLWTAFVSLLTLTPFVYSNVIQILPVVTTNTGPAIAIFGLTVFGYIGMGIFSLVRKFFKSKQQERFQMEWLLVGMVITFFFLITFDFIFPAFLNISTLVPLGGLFLLPFIIGTAYEILQYRLFNIRVAVFGILTFLLATATFFDILFSNSFNLILYRIGELILVLISGIWLIRAMVHEVEQREHIEKLAKELESANVRLKELDQLKSEFLSVASHQLRAPITAIRGYVANVLDGSYGVLPDYLKEPLSVVQESSRVMVSSIEDYLNISRIEQGRMKYESGPVEVTAVAKRAVEEFQPIAKSKNLILSFTDSPSVTITADFGKVKQIFTNLIDNALKYTPQGSVTVSITKEADGITFMTSDTGIGIAPDEINALFEKFTRARDANQVNTTGTGLGLYVVKKLVEGQGGAVHVESDGKGKGSRFIVKLPLVALVAPETSAAKTA